MSFQRYIERFAAITVPITSLLLWAAIQGGSRAQVVCMALSFTAAGIIGIAALAGRFPSLLTRRGRSNP